MELNIDQLKSSLDIVDVVERYVPLKKGGKNYFGFCPFHSNTKTPSFTVEPSKQFCYCFGCGWQGDVIKFTQDITGMDFIDTYKSLGGYIEEMPPAKVLSNQRRATNRYKLPESHCQDEGIAAMMMESTVDSVFMGTQCRKASGFDRFYFPICNIDGEIINSGFWDKDNGFDWLAGGASWNGFFLMHGEGETIVVQKLKTAAEINKVTGQPIMVCFESGPFNYVSRFNHGDTNPMPVIADDGGDQSIAMYADHLFWNGETLKKRSAE